MTVKQYYTILKIEKLIVENYCKHILDEPKYLILSNYKKMIVHNEFCRINNVAFFGETKQQAWTYINKYLNNIEHAIPSLSINYGIDLNNIEKLYSQKYYGYVTDKWELNKEIKLFGRDSVAIYPESDGVGYRYRVDYKCKIKRWFDNLVIFRGEVMKDNEEEYDPEMPIFWQL